MAKKYSKNSKKTTRRATSAIWIIFAELDKTYTIEDKLNVDADKHVLAMFLTRKYLE